MVESVIQAMPEAIEALNATAPMGRMGRPEEVAECILWLLSEEASFVTGHGLVVDGGYVIQ